ncbi:hypothetical protein M422DRAFT_56222 [Sphaerobolus stellatus SS14]|uniref:Uncharacterized protein n=1 Tax=Sphaerobolus stellatus (strain SS14) TaxID=990650 RepID=A0A0C9TSX8_SPHS4|nr:hypothetical protein M422DRAFT_56222 [Sphaerobolus stellatus SS14]
MSSQNPIIVTLPHDGEAFEDFLSCVLNGFNNILICNYGIHPKSETGQRLLARLISLCRLAFDYSSASILKKGLYCIQNSFMDLKDLPDLTGLVKQLLDLATDIGNIPMKAKLRYIIAFKNRTLLSSVSRSERTRIGVGRACLLKRISNFTVLTKEPASDCKTNQMLQEALALNTPTIRAIDPCPMSCIV